MATFKSIQPTDENIRELQNSLNEADITVQGAYDKIHAALASLKVMLDDLKELYDPDNIVLRHNIKAMFETIEYYAADAEDIVSREAEKWGANYISDDTRELILKTNKAAQA